MEKLQELIARAATDPRFRAKLAEDPRTAAAEAGFKLTEEDFATLKASGLVSMGEDLQPRITK